MGHDEKRHRALIRGLQIFAEAGIWGVHAEHDEVYAGPDDDAHDKLTTRQADELRELGWHKGDESWGFFT